MKNTIVLWSMILIVLVAFIIGMSPVFAAVVDPNVPNVVDPNPPTTDCDPSSGKLCDPLGNNGDPAVVANKIIKGLMGLTGILALIAFIWGGILWMTSGGGQERIKKGKTMMIWAVLGLVVIFGSYAILDVVLTALGV